MNLWDAWSSMIIFLICFFVFRWGLKKYYFGGGYTFQSKKDNKENKD